MSTPTAPHLHRSVSFILFIVASLSSLPGDVFGVTITISSSQDLIDISNNVNSGTTYSGTTVYLGSDLDFSSVSGKFKPIGTSDKTFNGTFDGQGHVISSLNINSKSEFVGVFGHSYEATFKNVVLDDSCSIVCYFKGFNLILGGVIGRCELCTLEDIVNMASVSFIGNVTNTDLFMGGIAGDMYQLGFARNCVNYGSVTASGYVRSSTYLGGIVGTCSGVSTKYLQNCANYGTITHKRETAALYMGGILGYSYYDTIVIENCVSAGKVANIVLASKYNRIGSIVGYTNSDIIIVTHCLWTSDLECDSVYGGKGSAAETITVTNSTLITLNATTTSDLNEYAKKNSTWDKWITLHLNGGTINSLTQDTLTVTQEYFPDPVKSENNFSFWCVDAGCVERYYLGTTDITSITDLYAGWNMSTVTFNFGNRTNTTKNVVYGEKYKNLPDGGEKEGHTFVGWFTKEGGDGERVTSETTVSIVGDHTLYAQWTINNYTITFIFDNGENDVVKLLNYSDKIDYPEDPSKEGHTFAGWSPKPATMPAHNLNVTAQWIEKPSEYVEIVFNKKDISEDEIREIIGEYTNNNKFTIETVVPNEETGEVHVVVKFAGSAKATEFIRNVNENVKTNNFIKRANVVYNYKSSSPVLCPLALFTLVLGSILIL